MREPRDIREAILRYRERVLDETQDWLVKLDEGMFTDEDNRRAEKATGFNRFDLLRSSFK